MVLFDFTETNVEAGNADLALDAVAVANVDDGRAWTSQARVGTHRPVAFHEGAELPECA